MIQNGEPANLQFDPDLLPPRVENLSALLLSQLLSNLVWVSVVGSMSDPVIHDPPPPSLLLPTPFWRCFFGVRVHPTVAPPGLGVQHDLARNGCVEQQPMTSPPL